MNRVWRYLAPIASATAAWLLSCGSLDQGPLNLTGGSGAGNPGGTITVGLKIQNDSVSANVTHSTAIPPDLIVVDSPITVRDQGGLPITITGVKLSSPNFRLVLDPQENGELLLDSLRSRPSYLSHDSLGLVINRQYSFNGLNPVRDSQPVIAPVARYTGVMLQFVREPVDTNKRRQSLILISGKFTYNGQVRKFLVDMNHSNYQFYKFAGGIFTLSKTDTTHLELHFNAMQWFRDVNIKMALDRGQISFNADGELILTNGMMFMGPQDIESTIHRNFMYSGRLVVY